MKKRMIAKKLRFPLVWTLFFIIIGIIIQSIKQGSFVFLDFFAKNHIQWFRSFGNFTDVTQYESAQALLQSIMLQWYYFFYTGGLISLLWAILSLIIGLGKSEDEEESENQEVVNEAKKEIEEEQKITSGKKENPEEKTIEALINQAQMYIDSRDINEAKIIYQKIQSEYDASKDSDKKQYNLIMGIYDQILELSK